MLNLIVDDLNGVRARVHAAGAPFTGPEDNDYGRFAWLMDPIGIKVELWQPPAPVPAPPPAQSGTGSFLHPA
jgi:predicted enzyme related to lactoylglutathione lyase